MSKITDSTAQVQAALDAISDDVTALDTAIKALQNSPGTLSPEDQAALDAIVAKSAALKAKTDAVVSTDGTPPNAPKAH